MRIGSAAGRAKLAGPRLAARRDGGAGLAERVRGVDVARFVELPAERAAHEYECGVGLHQTSETIPCRGPDGGGNSPVIGLPSPPLEGFPIGTP